MLRIGAEDPKKKICFRLPFTIAENVMLDLISDNKEKEGMLEEEKKIGKMCRKSIGMIGIRVVLG